MSVDGAVVLVTGASGGLGGLIAAGLAARGAHVVAAARRLDAVPAVVRGTDGPVACDIRDPASCRDAVAAAVARHGRLDGVVNAAGIVAFGNLADTDDEVVEELFLTNTLGPLWLTRAAIPHLQASRGFSAHLSAVVAETPLPGMAAYSASKAALSAADAALWRELRRSGIRVCDIRPPHTETGLAGRPIAGTAPRFGAGLAPEAVADVIVAAALDADPIPAELAAAAFTAPA